MDMLLDGCAFQISFLFLISIEAIPMCSDTICLLSE